MGQLKDDALINRLLSEFRKRVGWVAFTPTLWQNDVQITATNIYSKYYVDDKKAHVIAVLQATAAGTANTVIDIGLPEYLKPVSGTSSVIPLGVFQVLDSGTLYYSGIASYRTLISGVVRISGIADEKPNYIGTYASLAIASGDSISMNLTFEV